MAVMLFVSIGFGLWLGDEPICDCGFMELADVGNCRFWLSYAFVWSFFAGLELKELMFFLFVKNRFFLVFFYCVCRFRFIALGLERIRKQLAKAATVLLDLETKIWPYDSAWNYGTLLRKKRKFLHPWTVFYDLLMLINFWTLFGQLIITIIKKGD